MKFSDGLVGTVCLQDELFGPMFEPLKDPLVFSQVSIDEYGAVCWLNGADIDPYALYQDVKRQTEAA